MPENVLWACAFVLACILFYKFALPRLKRFDAENVRRIAEQAVETSDPNAHFRHAMAVADEQIEAVQEIRIGSSIQYLFETSIYADRGEAEDARARRVAVIARRFYEELPAALAGGGARGRMSARERAAHKWHRRGDETLH
jgi:hypothetical protein